MPSQTPDPRHRGVSRPLPIPWYTRLWDRLDARRCALAPAPHPSPDDPSPSTNRIESIRSSTNGAVEAERLAYLRDTLDDRVRLAELQAEFNSQCAARQAAEDARKRLLDDRPPAQPRAGEGHLPEASVQRRRHTEFQRQLTPLTGAVRQATARMDELSTEIALVTERVASRLAIARARSRRLIERQEARVAGYRAALCKHHPQGAALNALFTASPTTPPEWLTLDSAVHVDSPR